MFAHEIGTWRAPGNLLIISHITVSRTSHLHFYRILLIVVKKCLGHNGVKHGVGSLNMLKCSIYCKSAKNNHSGFTAPRNFHSCIDLQIASWPWVFLRHLVSLALRWKWSLVRGVEGCWRLTRSYKILTRSFLHWRIQVCGLQHYSSVVYPYHPMAVVDILWWYQICNRAIWAIKIESYLLRSSFNLMVNPKHWPGHDVRLPGGDAILFCLWWNLDRQDTKGRAGPLDITAGPRTLEIHTCLSIIVCRELQTNILYYIQNMSTLLNSLSALSCR